MRLPGAPALPDADFLVHLHFLVQTSWFICNFLVRIPWASALPDAPALLVILEKTFPEHATCRGCWVSGYLCWTAPGNCICSANVGFLKIENTYRQIHHTHMHRHTHTHTDKSITHTCTDTHTQSQRHRLTSRALRLFILNAITDTSKFGAAVFFYVYCLFADSVYKFFPFLPPFR
uniref:cDNA FLJ35424 fis, clone SMINT2001461 n=1 Tax=Homo sapiens TaxID=9606 RepID=Q8NAF7_HUMAN|nr:unnamed protein product [Homo sapiens]